MTQRERLGEEAYRKLKLAYNRQFRKNNPEKTRQYSRTKTTNTKRRAFALYGSKCKKCEFTDSRALQIDHINGVPEGLRRMPANPHRGGIKLYMAILSGRYPMSDFQLLCANCNWIKRFENKEYGKYNYKGGTR